MLLRTTKRTPHTCACVCVMYVPNASLCSKISKHHWADQIVSAIAASAAFLLIVVVFVVVIVVTIIQIISAETASCRASANPSISNVTSYVFYNRMKKLNVCKLLMFGCVCMCLNVFKWFFGNTIRMLSSLVCSGSDGRHRHNHKSVKGTTKRNTNDDGDNSSNNNIKKYDNR